MTNYETYKTFTVEQKEEYNFRFKEKTKFEVFGVINTVTIFILSIAIFIFVLYLSIKEPALIKYQSQLISTFEVISAIVKVLCWLIIINLLYDLIVIMFEHYQEQKWFKTNNIKRIYWWSKWTQKK